MILKFEDVINRFEPQTDQLEMLLGYDDKGQIHSHNFNQNTNILMAGVTGSGKSVTLSQMLLSMMVNYSSDNLHLYIHDAKRVDFRPFEETPHVRGMMYDEEDFNLHLDLLITLAKKRINQFHEAGDVKDIHGYNEYAKSNHLPLMPKIVTVIDKYTFIKQFDYDTDISKNITRILQLSRATGIYFVISTQTPRRNIFDGLLKSNIHSRLALKTTTATESQIVLDELGAEKLPPHGAMLYKNNSDSDLVQIQSSFVSDEAIESIIDSLNEEEA